MVNSLSELSDATGLELPMLLLQIEVDGRSVYPDVTIWRDQWRSLTLAAHPVLSCVHDFEWLAPCAASNMAADWLNPRFQNGRKFLPFAQTGAGDAYCLTPMANGSVGVAIVWHDREKSHVETASFEDFVYTSLVSSAVDFSHLIDEGLSTDEATQCVLANIAYLKPLLSERYRIGVERMLGDAKSELTRSGMIGKDAGHAALVLVTKVDKRPFVVVSQWECE